MDFWNTFTHRYIITEGGAGLNSFQKHAAAITNNQYISVPSECPKNDFVISRIHWVIL